MRDLVVAVLASVVLLFLAVRANSPALPTEPPPRAVVKAVRIAAPLPPKVELPPAEPSKDVPTLVEAGEVRVNRRVKLLAAELSKMWTRNPEELVTVIDEASRQATESPSVTLLLAIAHAETNGKILDVSEAGAVGLAQATPIACRQEKLDRKLYVTDDYLIGSRAYIMKKPLGDADTIASLIVTKDTPQTRKRARRLLESAMELRLEGVNELELLEPYASQKYFDSITAAKVHNLKALRELDQLLKSGSKVEMRAYRDRVRKEYRELKRIQLQSWSRYQVELATKRDVMLEKHFGLPAAVVKKNMPYEAGEYLGHALDERFSARDMASFLVRHLERKAIEARRLAGDHDDIEQMTAALYNGGSHNVKRMLAGLIGSLPETQKYMRKVPATRRRLDAMIASVEEAPADLGR
jgi:hypothetical protein